MQQGEHCLTAACTHMLPCMHVHCPFGIKPHLQQLQGELGPLALLLLQGSGRLPRRLCTVGRRRRVGAAGKAGAVWMVGGYTAVEQPAV